jgi:hypothetical protein
MRMPNFSASEEPVEISDQALEAGLALWLHGRVRPLAT